MVVRFVLWVSVVWFCFSVLVIVCSSILLLKGLVRNLIVLVFIVCIVSGILLKLVMKMIGMLGWVVLMYVCRFSLLRFGRLILSIR